MGVAVHSADFVRQDLFFAANAGHKPPEFRSLGAERNMNKVLHVSQGRGRTGHRFVS
jgi:hypothetical protein